MIMIIMISIIVIYDLRVHKIITKLAAICYSFLPSYILKLCVSYWCTTMTSWPTRPWPALVVIRFTDFVRTSVGMSPCLVGNCKFARLVICNLKNECMKLLNLKYAKLCLDIKKFQGRKKVEIRQLKNMQRNCQYLKKNSICEIRHLSTFSFGKSQI